MTIRYVVDSHIDRGFTPIRKVGNQQFAVTVYSELHMAEDAFCEIEGDSLLEIKPMTTLELHAWLDYYKRTRKVSHVVIVGRTGCEKIVAAEEFQ